MNGTDYPLFFILLGEQNDIHYYTGFTGNLHISLIREAVSKIIATNRKPSVIICITANCGILVYGGSNVKCKDENEHIKQFRNLCLMAKKNKNQRHHITHVEMNGTSTSLYRPLPNAFIQYLDTLVC